MDFFEEVRSLFVKRKLDIQQEEEEEEARLLDETYRILPYLSLRIKAMLREASKLGRTYLDVTTDDVSLSITDSRSILENAWARVNGYFYITPHLYDDEKLTDLLMSKVSEHFSKCGFQVHIDSFATKTRKITLSGWT